MLTSIRAHTGSVCGSVPTPTFQEALVSWPDKPARPVVHLHQEPARALVPALESETTGAMLFTPVIPVLWRLRQGDYYKFQS